MAKSTQRRKANNTSANRRRPASARTRRRSTPASAKTRQSTRPSFIGGFFRLLFFGLIAVSLVGAIALAIYTIQIDQEVRSKFAGKRWAIPARVYARPLELFAGMRLSADEFANELQQLPFHSVSFPKGPGSYSRNDDAFELYTRAFKFWDGLEPSRHVELRFEGNQLRQISSKNDQAAPALMRLEPVEIAGIYPMQGGEDRVLVQYEDLPQVLIDTLLAVEDRSFYSHFGIDPRGIVRAFVANLRAGRTVQGGSTLTQQLVKNFFLTNERTLKRKLKEMLMAILIDWHYSKEEILEAYSNEIYLGQDGSRAVHGFGLASRFYFDRALTELDLHHLALLVGLAQGPSRHDPWRTPAKAKLRRAVVLDIMVEQNLVSYEDAAIGKQMPLDLAKKVTRANSPYPAFLDLVKQQLRENYREEDLLSEGLKIFTTLDPLIQSAAEQVTLERLPELEKQVKLDAGTLQSATVVTESQTGEVRAIVGGRDVRLAGFNRALQAQRPAGSLLKPAVYLTALESPQFYTLATLLDDANPLIYTTRNGQIWEPQNYDKKMHGMVMLRDALAKSYNIPTARLGLEIDLTQVVKTLQRLGLERNIPPYPSLVLGAVDLSPFEVTQMFAAFASGGYHLPLRAITDVIKADGTPLPRQYSLSLKKAIEPGPAFLITKALQHVITNGTARKVNNTLSSGLGLAGKTGTTDELRDSWFAGFSGNLLSVVWVGRDDNQPAKLSGAKGALPIWIDIMKQLPLTPLRPREPADIEQILIDPESGQLANNRCEKPQWVPFLIGSAPNTFAPCAGGFFTSTNPNFNAGSESSNNLNNNNVTERNSSTTERDSQTDSLGSFFRRLLE